MMIISFDVPNKFKEDACRIFDGVNIFGLFGLSYRPWHGRIDYAGSRKQFFDNGCYQTIVSVFGDQQIATDNVVFYDGRRTMPWYTPPEEYFMDTPWKDIPKEWIKGFLHEYLTTGHVDRAGQILIDRLKNDPDLKEELDIMKNTRELYEAQIKRTSEYILSQLL